MASVLNMFLRQSKDEEDKLDKLDPTIRYLQKLGPKYTSLIFSEAKWVFKEDARMATRVCTTGAVRRRRSLLTDVPYQKIFVADEPEVEALPRHEVAQYLEDLHKPACIQYLEHIINELGEAGPDFHDKLVELYLQDAKRDWKKGAEGV
jgi:hypothetical protein